MIKCISFWPALKAEICFDQFFPIQKIHNTGSYRRPDDRQTFKTCSIACFRWFDESVIMSKYSQSEFWSAMSAMWVFLIDLNRLAARQQAELPKRLKGEGKTESLGDANTFIQPPTTEWKETTYIFLERILRALWHTYIHKACLAIVDFLYGCDSVSKFAFAVQYKNMLKGSIFPSAAMSTPPSPYIMELTLGYYLDCFTSSLQFLNFRQKFPARGRSREEIWFRQFLLSPKSKLLSENIFEIHFRNIANTTTTKNGFNFFHILVRWICGCCRKVDLSEGGNWICTSSTSSSQSSLMSLPPPPQPSKHFDSTLHTEIYEKGNF